MKLIEVDNCQACPFAVNDEESGLGWYRCGISDVVTNALKGWEDLPFDKVHELCPLKKESITIELKS